MTSAVFARGSLSRLPGLVLLVLLGGCTLLRPSTPSKPPQSTPSTVKFPPGVPPPPRDLASIPDAIPRDEPLSRYGNPETYVVFGKRYRVMKSAKGFVERGAASWYGPGFHGERTSSGEPYDMYAMTAAHKSLPIPSYVRVTNLDNGRSIVVRVNDRGPFVDKRIIDLSYTAAWKLDMLRSGTAPVEIRVLDPNARSSLFAKRSTPPPERATAERPATRRWDAAAMPSPQALGKGLDDTPAIAIGTSFLQVAAFGERGNAESVLQRLREAGITEASIRQAEVGGRQWFRVQVGPLRDLAEAERLRTRLAELGFNEARPTLN